MNKYEALSIALAVSLVFSGATNAEQENIISFKAEQIKAMDQMSAFLNDAEPPSNGVHINTESYPRMIAWSPSVRIMSAKQAKIIVWSRSVKIVPRSDVLK